MPPKKPALYPLEGGPLAFHTIHESQLRRSHIDILLDSAVDNSVGLAPIYGPNVTLTRIALATPTRTLVVEFSKPFRGANSSWSASRQLLEDFILCDESIVKYAFVMDKLAFCHYHYFGLRISSARGLLEPAASGSLAPGLLEKAVHGVSKAITKDVLSHLFRDDEGGQTQSDDNIGQAWLAQHVGTSATRASKVVFFGSSEHEDLHLEVISKLYCLALRLRELKPTVTKNDISKDFKIGRGFLDVTSTRFKTRITQASQRQTLQVQVSQHGRTFDIAAQTKKVEGRGVKIGTSKKIDFANGAAIVHVKTLGREPATNAEEGTITILDNRFVQTIFFPECLVPWAFGGYRRERSIVLADRTILNGSQGRAVDAIISLENRHRVLLVHGPPGTGKTTVIAAAANSIISSDPSATVWLVAHSNVAVKNIAEKLVNSDILDFKIIVSKEFHFDWHEHLYQKVEHNLIRTDSLPKDPLAAERMLLGSRIILSTLSNLLNNYMGDIQRVAPVQTLIVDEASQIELVFIGDDKQLAPYGYEQIKELESIFEKKHLRGGAISSTLNRMPVPLGNFISQHVYNGRLQTIHSVTSHKACRFVNVNGSREDRRGHSWVNYPEANAVIAIARQLEGQGKTFRIITPYDPQRSHIENELKRQNMTYEDKLFNVDSFQGNEAEYIIVSLVRSGDKLGFLQENRRINVMLTRCKRGMVIVSNRVFVGGAARKSLVGKLAASLDVHGDPWVESKQVVYGGYTLFK